MQNVKDCTIKGMQHFRGSGALTEAPAFQGGLRERLLRQDLNPVRKIALFALGLRGSELKQVSEGEFYGR